MKRPIIPIPRKRVSFASKFGKNVALFGSPRRHEPPPKTYLPHILFGLTGLLTLSLVVCLLGFLPKVGEVSAEGGRMYDAAQLLQYADIESGDDLLGFDSRAVEKRLKEAMPLLKSVNVRKHINGDVSITTEEYDRLYYTCHNRNYYAFTTDKWDVLCALSEDGEPRRVGAVYVGLPECARVRVDEQISFIDLPYETESLSEDQVDYDFGKEDPKKENAYVREFVNTLMTSSLAPRVRGMELSDRYHLWFVLDGSIRVSVGDISELSEKLRSAEQILTERAASGVDAGEMPIEVNVSDPTRIVVRSSPDVDIPSWGRTT